MFQTILILYLYSYNKLLILNFKNGNIFFAENMLKDTKKICYVRMHYLFTLSIK